MDNAKQQVVLVTGGSRGLGLAIVESLAKAGYSVVAAARSCTPELEQLMSGSGHVAYEPLDLVDRRTLHEWSKNFVEKHGAPYALINNAAIAHDGVLGTMHESQIEEVIAVNVTATLLLTKYISRSMLRNRIGRIVNVSSIIASTGFNGLSVYAASKAALNGFTKSLSRELGKVNITVNAVAPGYMETNMSAGINNTQLDQVRRRSALKRLAKTSEVASTVKYLLSDEAAAITGAILTIDAGNTA
ncbi:MAG TPA: SDR family oxidoreductase [Marinobacter salarius]|uniref:SDR family NAD(P)-dependent oxidoreductase n=1 Tax=Marinobacter salarius TaxID=1420917 RepID=UPI001A150864|nr:SDR family oxidoreductase [Marinobacter salarius]HIP01446.1 SDR family oxidoreductase [Marinobacter salarius]